MVAKKPETMNMIKKKGTVHDKWKAEIWKGK